MEFQAWLELSEDSQRLLVADLDMTNAARKRQVGNPALKEKIMYIGEDDIIFNL